MEELVFDKNFCGIIACCECGAAIQPNLANMCISCVRSKVDITCDIAKQSQLYSCRNCERYLLPPNTWTHAKLESKELLSICLKRIKSQMSKVRLVDAVFLWTEPHSKHIKVKITIQKEVFVGAILQQSFVIEYVIYNQMCEECRRIEAKDYWRACVQVRQKCDFKKTLFYMEQLMLKHNALANTTSVKPGPTGIDFFFVRQQDAKKLVEFLCASLPCKSQYSQQLITHDTKSNVYDYKHTFCVDIVPITKDCLICLPKKLAQQLGNLGQFVVCLRITSEILLIDPSTLQLAGVTSTAFWKDPFEILCQPKSLVEFYVLEIEEVLDAKLPVGHGQVSTKHGLSDVWVVRSNSVGQSNAKTFFCRTHLGHLLSPGDSVLGYDLTNSNLNSTVLDSVKIEHVPDVVLIRKAYDRTQRMQRRKWKLKRFHDQESTTSIENNFIEFMEDIEEDSILREKINIYKDTTKICNAESMSVSYNSDDIPEGPTLDEMLNELDLDDVEMKNDSEK